MSIYGKVALVTGGASGIGLAVVKELLKNDAKGVAIIDIAETNGLDALEEVAKIFGSDRVIFIKADVSEKEDLREAFDKTVERFKNLDIVINNAGIVNEVNWEKTLNVLLVATIRGTHLALQEYLPKYKSGDEGVIVNTASIVGLQVRNAVPVYCTAKRGIITLGETLGTEAYYNKYKSKILTICPGVVETPMLGFPDERLLIPELKESLLTINKISQRPEYVAQKYVDIINKGLNGSIWMIEEEEPEYEVVISSSRKTVQNVLEKSQM